jgi:hypothetical protein
MPNNQDNGALEEFYLKLVTNIDVDFIGKIIQQAEKLNKSVSHFLNALAISLLLSNAVFSTAKCRGMPGLSCQEK